MPFQGGACWPLLLRLCEQDCSSARGGVGVLGEVGSVGGLRHAQPEGVADHLGDQPVTGVAFAPKTGAVFAATDYGVLTLAKGASSWVATAGIPPVLVSGLTIDPSGSTLYAATHGRSIWKLRVK